MAASLYIAGFEALGDSIVGRIRDSFWTGFEETGDKLDPKYQSEVLANAKHAIHASVVWLKEQRATDEGDLEAFERTRKCRS